MVVFDTTGGLSIFGKKVALDKPVSPNKWYQIRVFITPSKNDGATSNTYTAYVNGKKVIENEPFKANDKDTTTAFNGFGYIRFGYSISSAPLPGGERYLQSLGLSLYIEVSDGIKLTGERNSPRGGAVIRKIVPVREDQDIYRKGCRSAVRRASHRRPLRTSG